MIANARMYSVSPDAGDAWAELMQAVARRAGGGVAYVDFPAPAPLADLWARTDQAAVFMCGLPYSQATPRPHAVAAPVPSSPAFRGLPEYWSEFVVKADSRFQRIEDTFGGRLGFTDPGSQSGCAAAMHFFMTLAQSGIAHSPVYREVIAPRITPLGVAEAVRSGAADVAPVDAYAWRLLQKYRSDLTASLRSIGSTPRTAIPLLVSSRAPDPALQRAFLEIGTVEECRPMLDALLLNGFARPDEGAYEALATNFEAARLFWAGQPLAAVVHPAFVV